MGGNIMLRFILLTACLFLANASCRLDIADQRSSPIARVSSGHQDLEQDPQVNQSMSNTVHKVPIDSEFFSSINFMNERHGIITGVDEQFWLTSDGGYTWDKHTVRGKEIARKGGAYALVNSALTHSGHIHVIGHLEEVGSAIFTSTDAGNTWKMHYYENSSLNDVDTVGDNTWVVGTINSVTVVLYSQGQGTWRQIWRGGNQQYLAAVDFIDTNIGWAVGANGLILHTTDGGRTWQIQQAPTKEALESVAFTDTMNGYAVGQRGVILHTIDGGNTWNKQESSTQANLTNIVAANPSEAWAVGQNGTVLFTRNAGQQWQPLDIGTRADVYALTIKAGELWVATSDGTLFRITKR